MLRAEVECLNMPSLADVPNVQSVPVFALQELLGDDAILDLVRRAPFAGQKCVMGEMPPKIVAKILGPTIHFPFSEDIKAEVIQQEDAARAISAGRAKGADVDTIRAAMHGMRALIAGACKHLLRLDDLYDGRIARVGLDIQHVDARRADTRHDKITAFDMR